MGKTTLIRHVANRLGAARLAGFYTEEVRDAGGRRTGFRAVTFSGAVRAIADARFHGPHRVGKYGVDVRAIDELTERELRPDATAALHVVDEIGKMECLSERFVAAVRELLHAGRPLLATVGLRGGGLIADVKREPGAAIWRVTTGNRDELVGCVLEWAERFSRAGAGPAADPSARPPRRRPPPGPGDLPGR